MSPISKIFGLLKKIILIPKALIDLIVSVVVELRRVEWLSLGNLFKTTGLVLFYATIIGIGLFAIDRLFEFLIIQKLLNLAK